MSEFPLKLQDFSPQFINSNSRCNSSFQHSHVPAVSSNSVFASSFASYTTHRKNDDSDLHQNDDTSLLSSKSIDDNKLFMDCESDMKISSKQSKINSYNVKDFTKLNDSNGNIVFNDLLLDNTSTGMSLFASSSSNNSSGGNMSKGGSGGQKQGGGRKQSGSDKSGFVNCLSCGLPCSKLDTECK